MQEEMGGEWMTTKYRKRGLIYIIELNLLGEITKISSTKLCKNKVSDNDYCFCVITHKLSTRFFCMTNFN